MSRIPGSLVVAGVIGAVAACSAALEPLEVIELRTEVSPSVVAVGDTITFRAIMRNPSARVLQPGMACGPPVLFELRDAAGHLVHPIPLDGIFTCPGLDYHQLEPFETDTVLIRWRNDLAPGAWSVRSGFRTGPALHPLSAPVSLTVN